MRGRIGSRLGEYLKPTNQSANGLWRLSEMYTAFKTGGFFGPDWPRRTLSINWSGSNFLDATLSGGGTISVTISPSSGEIPYSYQWQRSVDSGQTWANVAGASGSGTVQFFATISLTLAGQTASNNGDLYRVVVNYGLRRVVSTTADVRVDTISVSWWSQPAAASVGEGGFVYLFGCASIVGQTFGGAYSGEYQWQKRVSANQAWANEGEPVTVGCPAPIQFSATASDDGHQYRIRLVVGTATYFSAIATISVT